MVQARQRHVQERQQAHTHVALEAVKGTGTRQFVTPVTKLRDLGSKVKWPGTQVLSGAGSIISSLRCSRGR